MSTKETLEAHITAYIANRTREIESESNPEYRKNRELGLASSVAWTKAHQSGRYVGEGSTHSEGINVSFIKYFATKAEAETEASSFPKFLKARVGSLALNPEGSSVLFSVEVSASLSSSKVNGAANETGSKRIKRFLSIVKDTAWHNAYCKNFLSREAFDASLAK